MVKCLLDKVIRYLWYAYLSFDSAGTLRCWLDISILVVRFGVIRLWIGLAIWWLWVGGSVLVVGLGVIRLCFRCYTILVVLLSVIRLLYDWIFRCIMSWCLPCGYGRG